MKKSIRAGVEEVRGDIGEVKCDVEQVDKKISHLRLAKKSKSKYDVDLAKVCVSLMASAKEKLEVKHGLNTRVTYKAAFDYNRATLVGHGITTVAEFTKIIRAQQAREQRQRMKTLTAKNTCANKGGIGIMHSMGKAHKTLPLAMMLAVAGALASPLRSAASPDISRGETGGEASQESCVAASYAPVQ